MKKTSIPFTVVFLIIALLMGSSNGLAQEAAESKNWEFNLAPFYLWAVTIDGDVTSGTNVVPVKVPFSDLIDNLEGAFIVHFEGMHKNKWGFLVDVNYLDVSNNVTVPIGPGIPTNVDFSTTLGELSGLYRINHDNHNFDVIAGVRYTKLKNKVTATAGPILADDSESWIDPIVGVRWLWDFAEQWKLVARGDIGGFGVGSDFAWQAAALVDWQPFKYVSFIGGYRAIGQDYKEGSGPNFFRFDATIHGPLLGVNFRW